MPGSDWYDICPAVVLHEPCTSVDGYGTPQYGDPVSYRGRRVFKQVRKASGGNVDFVQGSEIWILGTPTVKNDDRVYVQGDTVYPPILNVEAPTDEDGLVNHVKVTLGSANGQF